MHLHKQGGYYTETSQTKQNKKTHNHLHVGLAIRELVSAEELISAETFASDGRVLGRSLFEWFIPFDAKLSSDIRFFFAGDLRAASDGSTPTIGTLRVPETLWPRYVSSSACAGGRRLERRRALSIRNGPMFERRRETFIATAAERGVGGGRCTGLVSLCFSGTFDSAEDGRFVLLLLLLLVLLVVLGGASSAKEL